MALAGVYDHEDKHKMVSALITNSWRMKVKKLLEGSRKPFIQEIQRILKEVNYIHCLGLYRHLLRLMNM